MENADLTGSSVPLADHLAHELYQREELLQAQAQGRRLSGLLEAISQMTGILDRNQLLQAVTEQASHLLEAERSTVFIVDAATHETIYNVSYLASKPIDLPLPAPHQKPIRQAHSLKFLTTNAISVELKNKRSEEIAIVLLLILVD